jgi:hypothetical protein
MSYPGTPVDHSHDGEGAIVALGTPGVIIMGIGGLQTNIMGTIGETNMGDTSGPNAVNPSGIQSGIRLPSQNNFGRGRRR